MTPISNRYWPCIPLAAEQQDLYLIDGFPMPVCGFKRAPQARVFQGSARFGRSATKLGTFYGFRGHLLISAQGAVLGLAVTPANVDERDVVPELVVGLEGLLFGDKGYIRQSLTTTLIACSVITAKGLKPSLAICAIGLVLSASPAVTYGI